MLSNSGTVRFLRLGIILLLAGSAVTFGLAESTGPGGSNVQAVHAAGYEGKGVSIGLISVSNILTTHEAFEDAAGNPRAFNIDIGNGIVEPAAHLINHDTLAAGIAIARGTGSHVYDNGAAPASKLYSVALYNLTYDLAKAIKTFVESPQGCQVIMAVIQGNDDDANTFWPLLYDYYAFTYNIIFANAAGNTTSNYNFNTPLTVPGAAYNGITTGGLDNPDSIYIYDKIGNTSLAGPTADERHKPDICAPSSSQTGPAYTGDTVWTTSPSSGGYTSYAAPQTAGVAAALLSYAKDNGIADDEQDEVIKAAIVNAAFPNIKDEYGNDTIFPSDPNRVWNAWRGYGRLDAYRALQLLQSDRISPGQSTNAPSRWAYAVLGSGFSHSYWVQGYMNERLVATLTWNRRVEWNDLRGPGRDIIEPGELIGHLADLDLEIYDSVGQALMPDPSTKDNLEKVDIRLPKSDTYEIRVVNRSTGESPAYALAFEVLAPLVGDVHVDYVVDLLDAADVAQYWLDTNCDTPGQACYAYNISPSTTIDLSDFALLAANWLNYDERYYNP